MSKAKVQSQGIARQVEVVSDTADSEAACSDMASSEAPAAGDAPAAVLSRPHVRLHRLHKALSRLPPISANRRITDLCELLDELQALPSPQHKAVIARLVELIGWELRMLRAASGRSERAFSGMRASIPPLLLCLAETLAGDEEALGVLAARSPLGLRRHEVRPPPPRAAVSNVPALLRDPPPATSEQTPWTRPKPRNAWSAAGLVDTRENYPLPPTRRGINGGRAGEY
eukprot:CAMPEP_0174745200 /NCGR_PEP_ID=MMETSP1094-20130205/86272_1 /TAXON_ID=156173 /ORGANISM="Chrysochromulina brevifilum, Strain UTEX LB 985" /LENGTH=228 /DNA_ID=CAMNT_0015949727 /DNA_START=234 /DNA_END=920 /DNA_ORIENTATION=-